ncbi:MAG: endonuclease V [Myxococcales bacterium]|nr:endonuclease V [Myxococcales bacterium]
MLACVDVDYRPDGSAVAACLLFGAWSDARPVEEHVERITANVAPYEPGELFRRELPCILKVLALVAVPLEVVVVDAYVTLDPAGRPGLGAHLHDALGHHVAGVGVAKTRYAAATMALPVYRGASRAPLWVTAVGIEPAVAAEHVRAMHGGHRIPTLLREVDRLARTA